MLIDRYSLFILILGLILTQGIEHENEIIGDDPTRTLWLDDAFLILKNTNYNDEIVLLGNKIICEGCDLERLLHADMNTSDTRVISTKYAYDLEVYANQMNKTSLCRYSAYKFEEHGTYILDVKLLQKNTVNCSITQVGELSNYWTPAILGIAFVVLYTIVVQIAYQLYYGRCSNYFRTKILRQATINDDTESIIQVSGRYPAQNITDILDDNIRSATGTSKMPLSGSPYSSGSRTQSSKASSKRLRALDTFRGFSLMVMIFVNYGGGGYWFFDHSIWNGLTLADLLFPWFTWMMGVSIVLSQRSLRAKKISKLKILWKIFRRTFILIVLGFTGNDDLTRLKNLRIPGVLQRLAICYFFTAILVLILEKDEKEEEVIVLLNNDDNERPLHIELVHTTFQFWLQWIFVILIVTAWILLTFLLHVPNCPTGYLGPGGKHDHGKYYNCTGGAAGYIDQKVLGNSHLYDEPTCMEIYKTKVNYDPEGILGNLTGILLCYLGVQAGHIFAHSTRVHRTCVQWFIWGLICGGLGLGLSYGGHSDSLIPINKNMWSLTFVLCLSSLAYFILPVLYILVDVKQWFTGAPFLWLGMNSIVIYICHDRFSSSFPVQFEVNRTHAERLAVHLYGSFFWSVIAGLMYYKKVFIAI